MHLQVTAAQKLSEIAPARQVCACSLLARWVHTSYARQLHAVHVGDYRDQVPPLIEEVHEQYRPVTSDGSWTHGLFEVRPLRPAISSTSHLSQKEFSRDSLEHSCQSECTCIGPYALAKSLVCSAGPQGCG